MLYGSPRLTREDAAEALEALDDASLTQQLMSARDGQGSPLTRWQGAFAVASDLGDGESVMAVDRFARETLCYRKTAQGVRWSRKATELAGANDVLDRQAIFDYAFFHAIPSPRTVFRDVHRLPAAHWARVQGDEVQVRPYWVAEFPTSFERPDFSRMAAEFKQLLERAVHDATDGGKPGCFLSGGTDSSTVSGMLSRVSTQRVATYSIGFDAAGYDEMGYARIAAKHFGTEHHEYYVTPDDLVASIPMVAQWFDQPFGNSSALPAYYCAKMARDDGVTRILAGDGGDELFGGNSRYAKQKVFDVYGLLPSAVRTAILEPMLAHQGQSKFALIRKAASYVEQARQPMPERTHLYNLLLRLGLDDVFERGFLASVDPRGPERQQRQVWEAARAADPTDRTLAYDWRYTLAESDLPKVRETAALAGLEVGYPMLDERILAFSQRIPPSWKVKGLRLRWFFKEALKDFLPQEIIVKKKQGFGLPFGVWATQHSGLKALATDSLRSLATRGFVRPAFVHGLLTQRLIEHPGYFGEMVWILMMLEQWLRGHAPDFRLED